VARVGGVTPLYSIFKSGVELDTKVFRARHKVGLTPLTPLV